MKNIWENYKKGFSNIFIFIAVIFLLMGFSFIVVFPIWFFANNFPKQYSFVVSILIFLVFAFILFQTLLKSYKKDREFFLFRVIKTLIFIICFSVSIFALFNWNRILAFLFFIAPFLLTLLLRVFGLKKE